MKLGNDCAFLMNSIWFPTQIRI